MAKKNPAPEPDNRAETQQALQDIAGALNQQRGSDAVRGLLAALEQELFPGGEKLLPWLIEAITAEGVQRLAEAMATFDCFYCRQGVQLCEDCDGRGYLSDLSACEPCVSLGALRCAFCDGSGWMTYSDLPEALRPAVLLIRVPKGLQRLKQALAEPLPVKLPSDPGEARKILGRRVLELNGLCGVLENAAEAAGQMNGAADTQRQQIRAAVESCRQAYPPAKTRLRELLKLLTKVVHREAKVAEQPAKRLRAKRRYHFYRKMAESDDFSGTALEHALLEGSRS